MKNEKNQTGEVAQDAQSVNPSMAVSTVSEDQLADLAEMIEKSRAENLDKMTPKVSLTQDYYEFESVGTKLNCVFAGFTNANFTDQTTGELKERKAVRFIVDGKVYLNSGYMLVDIISKSNIAIGTPISIEYIGKVGNGKKYEVNLLG